LAAEHGISAGENRVQRLCSAQRLWSVHSKKRGLNRKAGPPVHDDLVGRKFLASRPNQLWRTDLTEHRTAEGKLYVCAIRDDYSNKVVGYAIGDRMKQAWPCGHCVTRSRYASRPDPGSFGQGQPVPVSGLRAHPDRQRPGRLDGASRRVRRQRRDGIVVRTPTEERPGPPLLAHPKRTAPGDRHLDRTHLPPRQTQRALGKLTPIEFEMLHHQLATAA